MRNLLKLLLPFLILSCETPASDKSLEAKGPFQGTYTIKLMDQDLREEVDSSDVGAKLILSMLEPLKLTVSFGNQGYAHFSGAYGLLNFGENDTDSVKYRVVDDRFYIDNVDFNDEEFFVWSLQEDKSIKLQADSNTIYLVPVK